MTSPVKLVYSNLKYLALAFVIFSAMLTGLLIISEYIFLEPFFVSHIPSGTELGFTLIVALSALSALVIPMNVYRVTVLRSSRQKISGGVFGSIIGATAGACSCGPIGFAVISTFGSVGAVTTSFLTYYEIPIRILAVLVLCVTYYTTIRSLQVECHLNN